jgi:uncharacterized protein YndB with AHSA1/START domain
VSSGAVRSSDARQHDPGGAGAVVTVSVSRVMPVDPAVAWDLLVDPARWPEWGPSVRAVDLPEGRLRAGSTGRVRTAVGFWVPFEVTGFDEGRSWAWKVAGVPATTHTVEAVADGCRVSFGVPTVAAPYALVCRAALARIEDLAVTAQGAR